MQFLRSRQEQRIIGWVDLLHKTDADPQGLGDGFRVDARIVLSRQDQALRVSSNALERDGPGWRVWVFADGSVCTKQVFIRSRKAVHA